MTPLLPDKEDTMSVDTIEKPVEVEQVSFSALDRCDRCGSQALAVARKEGLADLLFCNHHKERYEPALIAQGFQVVFDRATYESYREPVAV